MSDRFPVLGYDIGGTKIAVCLGMNDGEILGSKRVPNKDRSPEDVLPELVGVGKDLLKEHNIETSSLRAIGIGAPGPMDIPNGMMLRSPNMPKWVDVRIRDYLNQEFGVPAFFENDANAGALAEWIFGAGKGCSDMLYLTMSTGIGGGLITNGHLLHGKGFNAGEVGHITLDLNGPKCNCGMSGCYEAFCGGRAIAQRLHKELANQPDNAIVKHAGGNAEDIDMLAVENAVRDGDEYAVKIWDDMCLRHAQAIGIFINTFNPEMIVCGTIAWATGDMFMDPVKRHLPDFCWPEMMADCKLTVSALGREIGEYSGLGVALNSLYEIGEYHFI